MLNLKHRKQLMLYTSSESGQHAGGQPERGHESRRKRREANERTIEIDCPIYSTDRWKPHTLLGALPLSPSEAAGAYSINLKCQGSEAGGYSKGSIQIHYKVCLMGCKRRAMQRNKDR